MGTKSYSVQCDEALQSYTLLMQPVARKDGKTHTSLKLSCEASSAVCGKSARSFILPQNIERYCSYVVLMHLCCTVLYSTVLYCTVLSCAVLCCAVLCCAVLCCVVLY